MKGRTPVPNVIKLLRGNPGKRKINRHEPKPAAVPPQPPQWLTVSQRALWRQTVKDAPPKLLTRLDREVLAVFVTASDLYRRAVEELGREGVVERHGRGLKTHPAARIAAQQAGIILRCVAEMGFSPSSRSRVSVPTDPVSDEDPLGIL